MVFAVTKQPGRIRHHNIHISNQIRASSLPSPLLFHRKWMSMELISYEWRVFFRVYMKVWNGRVKSHMKHLNSENSFGPHMKFVQKDQWHYKKTRNSCHLPILTFLCSSWQLTINKIKKTKKKKKRKKAKLDQNHSSIRIWQNSRSNCLECFFVAEGMFAENPAAVELLTV